jgi:hypothetical protein
VGSKSTTVSGCKVSILIGTKNGNPCSYMILGSMWSQKWTNIQDITSPYPGKAKLDVTSTMVKQVGKVSNNALN